MPVTGRALARAAPCSLALTGTGRKLLALTGSVEPGFVLMRITRAGAAPARFTPARSGPVRPSLTAGAPPRISARRSGVLARARLPSPVLRGHIRRRPVLRGSMLHRPVRRGTVRGRLAARPVTLAGGRAPGTGLRRLVLLGPLSRGAILPSLAWPGSALRRRAPRRALIWVRALIRVTGILSARIKSARIVAAQLRTARGRATRVKATRIAVGRAGSELTDSAVCRIAAVGARRPGGARRRSGRSGPGVPAGPIEVGLAA